MFLFPFFFLWRLPHLVHPASKTHDYLQHGFCKGNRHLCVYEILGVGDLLSPYHFYKYATDKSCHCLSSCGPGSVRACLSGRDRRLCGTFQLLSTVPKLRQWQCPALTTAERVLLIDMQTAIAGVLLCLRNPVTGVTTSRFLK